MAADDTDAMKASAHLGVDALPERMLRKVMCLPKSEQSCTELHFLMCHSGMASCSFLVAIRRGRKIKEGSSTAMDSFLHQLLARVHEGLKAITASFRNLGANGRDFGSQRMCPFCGLITSSRKIHCLECGKILKPA